MAAKEKNQKKIGYRTDESYAIKMALEQLCVFFALMWKPNICPSSTSMNTPIFHMQSSLFLPKKKEINTIALQLFVKLAG
jgi:hypothetical protein